MISCSIFNRVELEFREFTTAEVKASKLGSMKAVTGRLVSTGEHLSGQI